MDIAQFYGLSECGKKNICMKSECCTKTTYACLCLKIFNAVLLVLSGAKLNVIQSLTSMR